MPYPENDEALNAQRTILYDLSQYDQYDNRFDVYWAPTYRGGKVDSDLVPNVDVYFPAPSAETVPRDDKANPGYCNYIQLYWADTKDTQEILDPEYPYSWALSKEIPIPSNDAEFRTFSSDIAPLEYTDSADSTVTGEKAWQSYTAYRARVICRKEWDVSATETNPVLAAEKNSARGVIVAATDWVYPTIGKSTYAYSVVNPANPVYREEAAEEYTPPAEKMKMYRMRSNLPIAQYSAGSSINPPAFGTVKWRSGFLHTWEGNAGDDSFPGGIPYGFRFHYNPAGWTQSVQMSETINPNAIMASQPDFLPLYTGYATISIDLFLNRIVDLSIAGDSILSMTDVDAKAVELANNLYQRMGVTSYAGVPGFVSDSALNSNASPSNSTDEYDVYRDKVAHAKRIIRQGTLYDLDFLYATVNGRALDSFHVRLAGTNNPSYTADWKASDYGFLNPRYVRVWLGPNITFVGRLVSVGVKHLMFTQYMVPTFSQVTLQIARNATFGNSPENSKELYNKNVVGTVDPGAEGNDDTGTETTD
jgi:hypothetical protein